MQEFICDKSEQKVFLHLQHINFSYFNEKGETRVIEDIDVSVEKGSFTVFVGPSGCGKSTILSIISGLNHPTGGIVSFNMENYKTPKIGYMLQQDQLFEWKNIYNNLMLGLEIQHIKTRQNIEFVNILLDKYKLKEVINKKPSELSGGMRQRIALIRTLAIHPDLLLLDEPFSALDYQTRLSVSQDVHDIIKKEQKTAILVTHDISEAISLADNIVILSKKPCKIKKVVPIEFEKKSILRENIRNSKLFQEYFDLIWKELQNEKNN